MERSEEKKEYENHFNRPRMSMLCVSGRSVNFIGNTTDEVRGTVRWIEIYGTLAGNNNMKHLPGILLECWWAIEVIRSNARKLISFTVCVKWVNEFRNLLLAFNLNLQLIFVFFLLLLVVAQLCLQRRYAAPIFEWIFVVEVMTLKMLSTTRSFRTFSMES